MSKLLMSKLFDEKQQQKTIAYTEKATKSGSGFLYFVSYQFPFLLSAPFKSSYLVGMD
jgi:hypothetical protein